MITAQEFEYSSHLAANADNVMNHAGTIEGVNYELMPLARMTAPRDWMRRPIQEWPVGEKLFTSCILLLGFLPADFHFFRMKSLLPNGFEEYSSTVIHKFWHHTRTAADVEAGGCLITDRLSFKSRAPFVDLISAPIYKLFFRHRHTRLKRKFGEGS